MARNETWGADSEEDQRLRTLALASVGLGEIEVLKYALDQAVAELRGLSGMVHWSGARVVRGGPRLLVASGVPPAQLQTWGEEIRDVIVRALRDGAPVCTSVAPDAGRESAEETSAAIPPTATLTAVPLRVRDAPVGVLSVLSCGPAKPTGRQRAFLRSLADWLAQRLAGSGTDSDSGYPRRQDLSTDSHLRQALKATRIGSWDWNILTGELRWDEAGLTVMGIDVDSGPHTIDYWVNLIHPDDYPRVMTATEEAVRTRGLFEIEYRARRPDGTTGWVQERGRLVLDEAGEPTHMIGTVWDTTESRIARESVSHALRYMSDAFLAVDRDWRITFVNLDAERLLGVTDPYGQVLWDLPTGKSPDLRAACHRAAAEREPATLDVQWPTDSRWYHVRLVPVPDGLTLYLADVTDKRLRDAEREAAEQAAAERTAWVQELTRALGDAVTARDLVRVIAERVLPPFGAAGLIVLTVDHDRLHVAGAFNHAADILDRLEDQVLMEPSPLSDALRSRAPVFITSRAEHDKRYPNLTRWMARRSVDDSEKHAWAILPLLVPGQYRGCCVISFDRPHHFPGEERTLLTALSGLISQALVRARLYEVEHTRVQELQHLQAGLRESLERQRCFTADASHELRTPLAGLRAQLEEAQLHPEETDLGELLEHTLGDVDRLQAITTDLLQLARQGADQASALENVDLARLIETEVPRRMHDLHPVRLRLEPGVMVDAVPGQIGRILTNLLDNAQRHAVGRVEVGLRRSGDSAELTVTDDGPGVPASERENIFQRFARLDTARSRDTGGTGLGLAIARDIAHAHHGTLHVEAPPTRGARFILRLPLTNQG
ncbi:ATP-binding protein [Streptosporangium sp. NPDC002544]|uniref:ATP-binding protein n=1 Tax=Streptosporangium sp. NPDC002544 TaxID=3154538 RepID=UPI00332422E0